MKRAIFPLFLLSVAVAQTVTQTAPSQLPSAVLQRDEQKIVEGAVVAYDWSTRYYMEGARVERFIFRAEGASSPTFMRVVLMWHPADQPRILPEDFYASERHWRLTLRTRSAFDFVREYCSSGEAPTFAALLQL